MRAERKDYDFSPEKLKLLAAVFVVVLDVDDGAYEFQGFLVLPDIVQEFRFDHGWLHVLWFLKISEGGETVWENKSAAFSSYRGRCSDGHK